MATELNYSDTTAPAAFRSQNMKGFPESDYDVSTHAVEEIDINDASQIHYWTERWDVSENALRKAVADVGTEVSELRIVLGR